MGHEWDAHTAVEATPDGFSAELDPGWVVGGGVNGGYLLGVIGRAIGATVPAKPDPIAVSAFYVSASRPGPATVRTRVVRDGGSTATVAAELSQGEDTRITALATYGDLSLLPDDVRTTAVEPALPPVEDCLPATAAPDPPTRSRR